MEVGSKAWKKQIRDSKGNWQRVVVKNDIKHYGAGAHGNVFKRLVDIFTKEIPADTRGNIPCTKYSNLECRLCHYLSLGTTIRSGSTGKLHDLSIDPAKKYNCGSKGLLLYAVECDNKCGENVQYVGTTSRHLRDR